MAGNKLPSNAERSTFRKSEYVIWDKAGRKWTGRKDPNRYQQPCYRWSATPPEGVGMRITGYTLRDVARKVSEIDSDRPGWNGPSFATVLGAINGEFPELVREAMFVTNHGPKNPARHNKRCKSEHVWFGLHGQLGFWVAKDGSYLGSGMGVGTAVLRPEDGSLLQEAVRSWCERTGTPYDVPEEELA